MWSSLLGEVGRSLSGQEVDVALSLHAPKGEKKKLATDEG